MCGTQTAHSGPFGKPPLEGTRWGHGLGDAIGGGQAQGKMRRCREGASAEPLSPPRSKTSTQEMFGKALQRPPGLSGTGTEFLPFPTPTKTVPRYPVVFSVAKSCPPACDPTDCSTPGSSVSPTVCSNSRLESQRYHPTVSSSTALFSFYGTEQF